MKKYRIEFYDLDYPGVVLRSFTLNFPTVGAVADFAGFYLKKGEGYSVEEL